MAFLSWILHVIRNPDELIRLSGYPLLILMLIIFAETGVLVFFLPGDSLLVTAGLYAARGSLDIFQLNLLLIPMAILGDAVSYFIGKKTGPAIFSQARSHSRFFNPQHLRDAHAFYEKHGGKTIIIARFMPIFRTFVPVVAGAAEMGYARFAAYNIIGGASWVASMTLTGYLLASWAARHNFPIDKHIEKLIILVVFLSILPALIGYARRRFGKAAG
jgi:membrane-associated protein